MSTTFKPKPRDPMALLTLSLIAFAISPKPKIDMPQKTTLERLNEIVANQLVMDPADIREESLFRDDLLCDSLDIIELTMAVEEEFGIEIPDDDAPELFETVGDAVAYLDRRLAGK